MVCHVNVRRIWIGFAAAMAVGLGGAAQAADVAAGKQAYAVCAACHGQQGEGNQAMNAPRLAGQEGWYLRRQMEAFQQGLRGTAKGDAFGAQMRPMAMAVTDPAALDNLIAYIGTLPDVPAEPTIQGDAAAGQKAYVVCASCHGQKAEGLEQMGGPRLAGQNDWYLVRQLHNYKSNLRGYDPKDIFGKQMQPMANTLTSDQAINDVVAYINTLR
ncbi:MAG TPA: c-type cytochrome [Pseudomonadales bacterium]